jgi:hypothetical protein
MMIEDLVLSSQMVVESVLLFIIKAFNPQSRRPVNGEVIIYEIVRDNNNRYKAENIQFARDIYNSKKRDKVKSQRDFGGVFTIIFFIGLSVSVLSGKLPLVIVGII